MKTLNPTPEQIKTLPYEDLPTNEEWEKYQTSELNRLLKENEERARQSPELKEFYDANRGFIEFTFLLKLPPRFIRDLCTPIDHTRSDQHQKDMK